MLATFLGFYNPWWSNPDWKIAGVTREMFYSLYSSIIGNSYVAVLKGTRQSGKTFLVKQCIQKLIAGGVPAKNIFYFLLDDPELSDYIEENPIQFAEMLKNEFESKGKIYVFFDEFQKVTNITNLIKIFYEFSQEIKFVLTGSSSLQIAEKVGESLLGRTETFLLHPFSFKEFLKYSISGSHLSFDLTVCSNAVSDFLLEPVKNFESLRQFYVKYHFVFESIRKEHLPRYLLTGGYPQSAMASTVEQGFMRINEIKQAFIEKDIISLLRIEKLKEFDKLLKVLALQSGSLLNFNDLQTAVGINYQTLISFFNILESTYLWSLLPVYATNKISSIKKRPKSYFGDVGLRNFLSMTFDSIQMKKEKGPISENFVFSQLKKFNSTRLNNMGHLYFWRSPDGNEIDFIFEFGKAIIPIEVKYQDIFKIKINRGFQTFLKKENLCDAIVVTENQFELVKQNGLNFFLIPLVIFAGI